jgi:hypothetical protein
MSQERSANDVSGLYTLEMECGFDLGPMSIEPGL